MRIFLLITFILVSTPSAFAQVILKSDGNVPNQYIVSFEHSFDITAIIKQQKSRAFKLLRQNQQVNIERLIADLFDTDLVIKKSLWANQSVVVTISSEYLDQLSRINYVALVKPDAQYEVESLGVDTLVPSGESVTDNLKRIGIDSLWNGGFRGQGVVVAILDTGVDINHKTLKPRWRGGSNSWFDPINGSSEPSDLSAFGHGTAVASLVLGGNEASGSVGGENYTGAYIGVAPNAQWIAAKIFASTTSGNASSSSISAILDALQWVLDPDGNAATDDYPDIVQNSWGLAGTEGSCTNTEFNASLDAINALGIDIVFAVGNSGPGPQTHLAPSFHDDVISVGAVSTASPLVETIVNSSSRGPNACNSTIVLPSLVAPGFDVIAAQASFGNTSLSATTKVSEQTGTSFSSPHVSGALALLRSYFSKQTDYLKFRQALFDTAKDLESTGVDPDVGRGLIQVDAAATNLLNDPGVSLRATGTIFSNASYVFSESTPNVEVSIIRTGDVSAAESITVISEAVTALSGIDYKAINTLVEFAAGESMKTVTVEILNDVEGETTEYFNLAIVGTNLKLRVNITDDDTVVEEDEIGGASSGLLELMFLTLLCLGMWVRRKA